MSVKIHDEKNMQNDSDSTDDGEDLCVPNTDLVQLLALLERLSRSGFALNEATLIGNEFSYYGLCFEHHGFVLPISKNGEFLSLDFSKRGIVWELWDDFPDMPDGTVLVERYKFDNTDVWDILIQHCKDTEPFNAFSYNCKAWCKELQDALEMKLVERRSAASANNAVATVSTLARQMVSF